MERGMNIRVISLDKKISWISVNDVNFLVNNHPIIYLKDEVKAIVSYRLVVSKRTGAIKLRDARIVPAMSVGSVFNN